MCKKIFEVIVSRIVVYILKNAFKLKKTKINECGHYFIIQIILVSLQQIKLSNSKA